MANRNRNANLKSGSKIRTVQNRRDKTENRTSKQANQTNRGPIPASPKNIESEAKQS